jgi:hypothetical protein
MYPIAIAKEESVVIYRFLFLLTYICFFLSLSIVVDLEFYLRVYRSKFIYITP